MKLKRRKKSSKQLTEEVKKVTISPIEKSKKVEVKKVISTGSTLLDLAISGNRIRGGGVPGGDHYGGIRSPPALARLLYWRNSALQLNLRKGR